MAKRKRRLTQKQIEKLKSFSKRGYAPIEKAEKRLKKHLGFQGRTERTQVEEKVDAEGVKIITRTTTPIKQRYESPKRIRRREKASRGILTAAGIIQGRQETSGAGRPRGSFKHGMPIEVYRKNQRAKKAQFQRYQEQQYSKLKRRGFSKEEVQQLQQQQTLEELQRPSERQIQQIKGRNYHRQIRMRIATSQHNKLVQPQPSVADEELKFRKWSSETSVSPNTRRILDTVRRIQNKAKMDNIRQQRILRERNMVSKSMSMSKAHENMVDVNLDFSGVNPDENILMAENVFKEKEDGSDNILRSRGYSILDTKGANNDLHF